MACSFDAIAVDHFNRFDTAAAAWSAWGRKLFLRLAFVTEPSRPLRIHEAKAPPTNGACRGRALVLSSCHGDAAPYRRPLRACARRSPTRRRREPAHKPGCRRRPRTEPGHARVPVRYRPGRLSDTTRPSTGARFRNHARRNFSGAPRIHPAAPTRPARGWGCP